MDLEVDIRATLQDRRRRFELCAQFDSREDFVVLFGPSGSGKSLTLQAIAGLVRPSAGRIRVGDRVLFDASRGIDVPVRERRIGYLFQDYALFPHLTVEQNVALPLSPWGLRRLPNEDRRRVADLLGIFELTAQAGALPRDLSGGQRQRAALARALVRRPDLLLLDEPFAALNPLLRAKMRSELQRIQAHFDVPVLLITHDPDDLERFGETVVMVDGGSVRGIFPFKKMGGGPTGRAEFAALLAQLHHRALEACA